MVSFVLIFLRTVIPEKRDNFC